MEFLSLSRRCPSSRIVPQRRGARKNVYFLRRPHSIIAKYVSCRSSKLRQSLKQSIRVNIVQVKPLVRYFSILVKKNVSIMFVFTLFVKARPSVPVIILCWLGYTATKSWSSQWNAKPLVGVQSPLQQGMVAAWRITTLRWAGSRPATTILM